MLKELVARFKLRTPTFNYAFDKGLDYVLSGLIDGGITYVKHGEYRISITFGNGAVMHAWSKNKYYAWLSAGYINKHGYEISWTNSRPSANTMLRLKKAIDLYDAKILD